LSAAGFGTPLKLAHAYIWVSAAWAITCAKVLTDGVGRNAYASSGIFSACSIRLSRLSLYLAFRPSASPIRNLGSCAPTASGNEVSPIASAAIFVIGSSSGRLDDGPGRQRRSQQPPRAARSRASPAQVQSPPRR